MYCHRYNTVDSKSFHDILVMPVLSFPFSALTLLDDRRASGL